METSSEQRRRIPLKEEFMRKKINDILYGYLQIKSTLNVKTNVRYIKKSDVNFAEIERDLKGVYKSRTLANNLKNLIYYGFIGEDTMFDTYGNKIKVYTFPYDVNDIYKLIPLDTLIFLVDTATPSVIATYAYLLNKWEWKHQYIFTEAELIKNCLGIKSATHSRDYERINNVLLCLHLLGLIDFKSKTIYRNNTAIKCQILINVSTKINKGKEG